MREALRADAVRIAEAVGYVNAGTVEFLVDRDGHHYFIEMNPRIQVEHTVTEMVTGIDIVRAQILIAEGATVAHPEIGLEKQSDLYMNGYSIQCRVTTEDPKNNFAPDNGKIVSYRSGGGFGVRLDGGNAAAGRRGKPLLRQPAGQGHHPGTAPSRPCAARRAAPSTRSMSAASRPTSPSSRTYSTTRPSSRASATPSSSTRRRSSST